MRELMVKMQPSCFEDLIALIALYRPGPLKSGMADTYVRRKHGQEPVDYPHDSLEPILRDTYGVIVYQEQVMLIAHHLAGFTLNQADSLRKAMGKKKHDVMAAFREQFVEGCVAQGHHRQMADDLFTNMEYFAGYGFNKSHSAAYAVLTYRTAWLKATYPTELLCALLTCDMGLTDKLKEFIEEARRMQIAVLPPAVNASRARFTVEDGAIRYGLAAIKGLGEKAADKLVAEREESGPFADVHDLARRWDAQIANKTCYEVLAKSGTFDTTGWSRRAVFEVLEGCLREAANVQADRKRGQSLMFGDAPTTASAAVSAPDVSEWPETIKLAMEKEALGLYLSGHPFKRRGKFFSLLAGADTRQIHEARNETSKAKREIVLAGMVSGLRPSVVRSGKNAGQRMAKFRLEDLHGSVSATVFSKQYARLKDRLADDALVFVHARIDRSSEEAAILIDDVQDAQTFVRSNVDAVVLRVDPAKHDADLLQQARDNLQHHRGRHRVFVDVADDLPANDLPDKGRGHYRLMADPKFNVELTAELLEDLSSLLGRDALSFTRR
jgi:DNA polymerase-3 subunit alpha